MRKFRDLMEAKDTIVFAFGRFNPPTTGHEKVIEKVARIAGSNPYATSTKDCIYEKDV